jgi:hypothetical protein
MTTNDNTDNNASFRHMAVSRIKDQFLKASAFQLIPTRRPKGPFREQYQYH